MKKLIFVAIAAVMLSGCTNLGVFLQKTVFLMKVCYHPQNMKKKKKNGIKRYKKSLTERCLFAL